MSDTLSLNININDNTATGGNGSFSGGASGGASGSSGGNAGTSGSGGVLSSIRGGYKDAKMLLNTTGVAMVAGTVINYTTSRVGITTGNYQKQQEINAVKTVLGQVATIGAGFAVGGIGGGLLATAGVGLSYALAYDTYNFNRRAEAAQLSIKREREGLISASRSRGANQ